MNGLREDVFSLPEGKVVLQWPSNLSPTSAAEILEWLAIVERKIQRIAKPAAPLDAGKEE